MSQQPTNISTYFYDASCIALSFSDPSSAYFNSAQTYYYLASAVDSNNNKTTYATGTKSPIYIQGLSAGYTYTCSLYMVQTASSDSIAITTLSYPTISDISLTDISINYLNVKWTASDVSYVTVTRRVGTLLPYTDICGADYSSPYYDTDISGNTTYYYYVTPYMTKYGRTTGGSISTVVTATTPVAYPTDVSATFYDTSAIKLQFSTPKNTYSSVTYTASAVYQGNTITTIGTSPILLQNLSSGTTYTCYIKVTLDSTYTGTSTGLSVTTSSGSVFSWTLITSTGYSNTFSSGNALINHKCYSQTGQYVYILPTTSYSAQYLYRSSDYGKTFSKVNSQYTFLSIACSSDGSIVWGVSYFGSTVYFSSDYGVTFTSSTVSLTGATTGTVECTGDGLTSYHVGNGNKIFKCVYSSGSFTYTSLGTSNYGHLSCSSDGTKILWYNFNTGYYVSTNSGSTWTSISTLGSGENQVWVSPNGTYMFRAGTPTYMSTDSGSTWTSLASVLSGGCTYISCSNDGKYILAGTYLSKNYGASFTSISSISGIMTSMNYTGQYMMLGFYVNGNYGS